jgi:hypothetical protein
MFAVSRLWPNAFPHDRSALRKYGKYCTVKFTFKQYLIATGSGVIYNAV